VYWYDEGKRVRKYGKINREHTEADRRAVATAMMAKMEADYVPPPPNKIQKAMLYAALARQEGSLRKKSYQTYVSKLNHFFKAVGDRVVDAQAVHWYFGQYLPGGHDSMNCTRLRQLRTIFSLADMGHLLADVVVRKGHPQPLRYFQAHQVRQLMSEMERRDPELRLCCLFVFYCFLRPRSELRLMKVSDIFFEERKIMVRPEIAKNKRTGYVSIPDAFWPAVQPLMLRPPNSYIFPGTERGKPTGYNTLGDRHRKLLRELGYSSDYALYSWKHTGAVMAVRAGIGLKELQLQLRHHSLDQVNAYLRQLNVTDFSNLRENFPGI
jgi:integrase